MQYRRLGNSGLHVSVLGLGGWLTYVIHKSIFDIEVINNLTADLVGMLKMVRRRSIWSHPLKLHATKTTCQNSLSTA